MFDGAADYLVANRVEHAVSCCEPWSTAGVLSSISSAISTAAQRIHVLEAGMASVAG